MKTENYKAIAGIISNKLIGNGARERQAFEELAYGLADYFESDDIEKCNPKERGGEKGLLLVGDNFNRKQFIKDCGLE